MIKSLIICCVIIISLSSISGASPSFIMKSGISDYDKETINEVLSLIDFKDYDSLITFNSVKRYDNRMIYYGYFSYNYKFNKKTLRTYDYRYRIDIYADAYVDKDVLRCTLQHELAHFRDVKNNRVNGYRITEDYANKNGCFINNISQSNI